MQQFRTKGIEAKVIDVDSEGVVKMYVSKFGNVDSDGDIIIQGAFKKTIQENGPEGKNRIKHLWGHNPFEPPMGRPVKMVEDENGLLVDSFISEQKNGDYRKMYSEGLITEHSIGFIPVVEEYNREQNVNLIKETKLFEYSSVIWGANADTPVVDMKSMLETKEGREKLQKEMDKISKVLKDSTMTDETLYNLTIQYERIKSAVFDALEAAKEAPKPPKNEAENLLHGISLAKMFNELQN